MDDSELRQRLESIEKKAQDAFAAADKTRQYMLWAGIITVALFVLPLIGLVFAIPSFLSLYGGIGSF